MTVNTISVRKVHTSMGFALWLRSTEANQT